jgi:hypothetical protein
MKELNAQRAYFNFLLGNKPTAALPAPRYSCITDDTKFYSRIESNFYDFMNLQAELPQLATATRYTNVSTENHAVSTITFSGKQSYWLPDFDVTLNGTRYYIEVKGASNQLVRLRIALRDRNRSLWSAVRRDLLNIALRSYTHVILELADPSVRLRPLLFLSRPTIDLWIQSGTEFRSERQLEATLQRESDCLLDHLMNLLGHCFHEEWAVFDRAIELYRKHYDQQVDPTVDPESILTFFSVCLEHAKTLLRYDDRLSADDRRFARFLSEGIPNGLSKYYPTAPAKRF